MTPKKLFIIMLALGAVLAGAALAAAQPGPGRGLHDGAGWSRIAERLDLTEEQKQAIDAIHADGRAQQLETRKQIVQLESQLRALLLADAPDETAALKLVGQISDLRAEQRAGRVKMRLAIRKQLTPEQRTQFILMEARLGRGPRGHGDGEGPGQHGARAGRGASRAERGFN